MVKEVFEQFTVGGTALRFSDQDMILVPIVMFVFALKLFKLGCRYSNEVLNREALSRSQHQTQTFCARQKDDLRSLKLVFVPEQKFLKRH